VTATATPTATDGPDPADTATVSPTVTDTATDTPSPGDTATGTPTANAPVWSPAISLIKLTDGQRATAAPGPYVPVGANVTWSYVVTNTGDVSLSQITVSDDRKVHVSCPQTSLQPGASMTCTGSGPAVPGQYTNVAVVTGTAPNGRHVTASDVSHYYGLVDPTVTNNNTDVTDPAAPAFTRVYSWSISKSADTSLAGAPGGTVSVTYAVTVKEAGYTDSGWRLTGGIELVNPNPTALSGVTVTDAVNNGGSCTVAGGTNVSLPAGGQPVTLGYSCTWAAAPSSLSGVDTVTASWDAALNHTPNGSAQSQTSFTFATPTTIGYSTVTIYDSFVGVLGTVTATDSTPYASRTFTYTRALDVSPICVTYTNTATIEETGQSATRTTEICGPNDPNPGPVPTDTPVPHRDPDPTPVVFPTTSSTPSATGMPVNLPIPTVSATATPTPAGAVDAAGPITSSTPDGVPLAAVLVGPAPAPSSGTVRESRGHVGTGLSRPCRAAMLPL
jgi:hypothetical protein